MHLCAYKIHMAFTHKPFKYFNPKQQMRFELYMQADPFGPFFPTYAIKSAERPTLENNHITVDYINTEFHVKGKSRWQPITIRFYDPIEDNGAKMLHDYINNYHHNSGTTGQGFSLLTPGEDGFIHEYKRTLYLRSLSPHGDVMDSFVLVGAFFDSVKWGEFDMSSDDLVLMEGTIVYDYAMVRGSKVKLPDVEGPGLDGGGANLGSQLKDAAINIGKGAAQAAANAGISALGGLIGGGGGGRN